MGDTPMDAAFKAMIAEQERDARFAAAADLERARATAVAPRSGNGARWGWLFAVPGLAMSYFFGGWTIDLPLVGIFGVIIAAVLIGEIWRKERRHGTSVAVRADHFVGREPEPKEPVTQASTETYLHGAASRLYTALWFAAAVIGAVIGAVTVYVGVDSEYASVRNRTVEDRTHWAERVTQARDDATRPAISVRPDGYADVASAPTTPDALAAMVAAHDAFIAKATAQRASDIKWFTLYDARRWTWGRRAYDYPPEGCCSPVTADETAIVASYERHLPFHSWSWLNVYTLLFALGSVAAAAAPILFLALLHWIGTGRRSFGWTW